MKKLSIRHVLIIIGVLALQIVFILNDYNPAIQLFGSVLKNDKSWGPYVPDTHPPKEWVQIC